MSARRSIAFPAALLLLALTGSGCSYFTASKKLDMQLDVASRQWPRLREREASVAAALLVPKSDDTERSLY
jgi:hypothetical protein